MYVYNFYHIFLTHYFRTRHKTQRKRNMLRTNDECEFATNDWLHGAESFLGNQVTELVWIPYILWNLEVNYCVHKSLPLDTTLFSALWNIPWYACFLWYGIVALPNLQAGGPPRLLSVTIYSLYLQPPSISGGLLPHPQFSMPQCQGKQIKYSNDDTCNFQKGSVIFIILALLPPSDECPLVMKCIIINTYILLLT